MSSAPRHKRIIFTKPFWLKEQEEFRKQNKICNKAFPECPKEEGQFCENCPFIKEVKKMPVSIKTLKLEEYSFDRVRALKEAEEDRLKKDNLLHQFVERKTAIVRGNTLEIIRQTLGNRRMKRVELLSKSGEGLDKLIGQKMNLTVIEVDSNNNKLIFSQRGQVTEEIKLKLNQFKVSQKVKGRIVAVLPFGLVVDVVGVEGLVFISDTSWEKVEDLSREFTVNTEVEVLVIGIDESFGRLNLSIKQLLQDPFSKLAEKYTPDETVKAEVLSVSDEGVVFKLEGVEAILPVSKMEAGVTYTAGNKITLLIDSVDVKRRKITLAPFITSTEGLIYK